MVGDGGQVDRSRASREGSRGHEACAPAGSARGADQQPRAGARRLGLPARPPSRGLTSDRAALAQQLARTSTPRRRIARLTHTVTTKQGEFTIDNYDLHETAAGDVQKRCGINIDVKYESPTSLRSTQIGFVQVMKVTKDGTPYLFSNEKPRATKEFSFDEGWTVDRVAGKTRGFYGMNDDLTASGTNYWSGSRTDDTTATDAKMHDKVGLNRAPGQEIDCQAMTYAVDIEHGTYLGGFSWGWSIDAAGTLAAKPVPRPRWATPSARRSSAGTSRPRSTTCRSATPRARSCCRRRMRPSPTSPGTRRSCRGTGDGGAR